MGTLTIVEPTSHIVILVSNVISANGEGTMNY